MKGLVRRSAKSFADEREERKKLLMASQAYRAGEAFTAAEASRAMRCTALQAKRVLKWMAEDMAVVIVKEQPNLLYSKPATNLNKISWRHNIDLYQQIEAMNPIPQGE